MKRSRKFLTALLCFVTILTALQGLSQTSKDSTTIAKKDALKVYEKGLQAKAFEAQRDLLLTQVDTLKARISIKDMLITTLNGKIEDHKSIIADKNSIISNQTDQRNILQLQVDQKNKEIKKTKRKTKWVALLGIITTGAATYLWINK